MTKHGVQDEIVDFFVGHAVSDADRAYWTRRVEEFRKIYADREQYLNPVSRKQEYDLSKIEGLQTKIKELEERLDELSGEIQEKFDVRIVENEELILQN